MPESIILTRSNEASRQANDPAAGKLGLSTNASDTQESFQVRSAGNYVYSMSVSSPVNESHSRAGEMKFDNFQLPANRTFVTSDDEQALEMNVELGQVNGKCEGDCKGSVSITVNFN